MKLQKHFAYKYKEKNHYKHVIVVPDEVVKTLGWNEGVELKQEISNGALVLKPNLSIDRSEEKEKEE